MGLSTGTSSAGLLLGHVLSLQQGLEYESCLGFGGDIGSVGKLMIREQSSCLQGGFVWGVCESHFWLSHMSAFLCCSWSGDQAASQLYIPCTPSHPI